MKIDNIRSLLKAVTNSNDVLMITAHMGTGSNAHEQILDNIISAYQIMINVDGVSGLTIHRSYNRIRFIMNGAEKTVYIISDSLLNYRGGEIIRGRIFDQIIIDEYCRIYEYLRNELPTRLRRK